MTTQADRLRDLIGQAQRRLSGLLRPINDRGGITLTIYHRYLSMQYHLTRGVQRYFFTAAGHADLANLRSLRQFLFDFANEEEKHYLVAANDLLAMGLDPLPEPFDVTLWHAYFAGVVVSRPFVRLGAACILENISGGDAKPDVRQALAAPFLNRGNSKFLVLHQHEQLPHGDQIVDALTSANLDARLWADVLTGAEQDTVMFLRMIDWALNDDALSRIVTVSKDALDARERAKIEALDMREIAPAAAAAS